MKKLPLLLIFLSFGVAADDYPPVKPANNLVTSNNVVKNNNHVTNTNKYNHSYEDNSYSFESPDISSNNYGGVSCSQPTLGIGGYGDNAGERGGFIGLSIPLGDDTCSKMAKLKEQELKWQSRERVFKMIQYCTKFVLSIKDTASKELVELRDFCRSAGL